MVSGGSISESNPESMPAPTLDDLPPMAGKTLYQLLKDVPRPKMEPELLAELEDLRGEPIRFTDPRITPCVEVSDEAVRSVEPLVSVHMITYNHENFIAEAIESVVHQETNFPFELVIGEDCSTDRTREIVLEYQKKYPLIIRVQYANVNLFRNAPVGVDGRLAVGNGTRTAMSCRGKYIAYCEGDDYWIDMKKLQKQVDILESHPEVGMCCTNAYQLVKGKLKSGFLLENYQGGIFSPKESFECILGLREPNFHPATLTVMIRRERVLYFYRYNPVSQAKLKLGDTTLWLDNATHASMACIDEHMAVRRMYMGSLTSGNGRLYVSKDSFLICYYFAKNNGVSLDYLNWVLYLSAENRLKIAELHSDRKGIIQMYRWGKSKQIYSSLYASSMIFLECVGLRKFYLKSPLFLRGMLRKIPGLLWLKRKVLK